jgi:hemolysin activation/secretion protein
LHALVADAEGQNLTLAQLNKVASRITDYYHAHGFQLVRAIIPAQTIDKGVVHFQIVLADYGKISLDNQSRVKDSLLKATLAPLQSGQVIGQVELDHSLLLLSDIPSVTVTAVLKPGEAVGSSDLLVNASPGPVVSGNVALDNYGNRYTGRARLGGTVNFINPLHHGDVLSLSGLSSGADLNYGRFSYETLVNGQGSRVGGALSALDYTLGAPLVALNAHGTAQTQSFWLRHPLVRSRDVNVYAQIQYDGLQLRDHIDAAAIRTDRSLRSGTLSLNGDARDAFLTGGINIWNLGLTAGHLGFDDASAQLNDAATARTQGGYSKWNAGIVHLENLGPKDGLYLAASGQWAISNLDASQKMIVGGPYTVRAYDTGALSGDSGYLLSAEYRRDLGALWYGQWMAVAFADRAQVLVNRNTWTTGENRVALSGVGVGFNWAGPDQWNAKTYISIPVGPVPAQVERPGSVKVWLEVSRRF